MLWYVCKRSDAAPLAYSPPSLHTSVHAISLKAQRSRFGVVLLQDDKGKQPLDDGSSDEEEEDLPMPDSPSKYSEASDMTCAICLGDIPLPDMAMVKGCGHIYCAKCILAWALHKENPWCPQCKQPFNYLLTYRTLDGELQDFPNEESVVLLKRARWLEDQLAASHADAAHLLEESRAADDIAWHDYADEYDLAEDEAIEAYYYSSAAGRARVMLGNRRFGEGGYIATGRRQARPAGQRRSGKGKAAAGANKKQPEKAGTTTTIAAERAGASTSSAVDIRTPNAHGGRKGSVNAKQLFAPGTSAASSGGPGSFALGDSPGEMIYGSSPAGSGRRARRNARRAASDAVDMSGLSPAPSGGNVALEERGAGTPVEAVQT